MPKVKVQGLGSMSGNLSEGKKYEDGMYELRLIKSEFVDNMEVNPEKPGTMYKYSFEFINEPDIEKSVIGEKFGKVVFLMDESHPSYKADMVQRNLNELANIYKAFGIKVVNDEIPIGKEIDTKNLEVKMKVSSWKSKDGEKSGQNFEFFKIED